MPLAAAHVQVPSSSNERSLELISAQNGDVESSWGRVLCPMKAAKGCPGAHTEAMGTSQGGGAGSMAVPASIPLPGGCELRVLAEADVDELHALIEHNRSHLARWLPWAADQTREDTREFIAATRRQLAEGNGFQAAVVRGGRIAGVVGFHTVSWQHRSTSLGYWLAEHEQGRGTEQCGSRDGGSRSARVGSEQGGDPSEHPEPPQPCADRAAWVSL